MTCSHITARRSHHETAAMRQASGELRSRRAVEKLPHKNAIPGNRRQNRGCVPAEVSVDVARWHLQAQKLADLLASRRGSDQ